FPGGIEGLENATLIFSVLAGIFYIFLVDRDPSWARSVVKTLSTALLAWLAWMLRAPDLLVLGLALSALGDLFLSRDGDKAFLGGLASFLAAHIAYIVLFHRVGGGLDLIVAEPWRLALAALVVVFALAVLSILLRRVPPSLRIPVIAYSLTIMFMGVSALTLHNWMIIAGAAAFMASDTLLGWERFVSPAISPNRQMLRYSVWVLYYLAQLLITLGFVLS
ncbi:lysoplasmalogenase, partial [Escherichia coli]|nr:lysoplasmalogenase [Escherichia coli]